MPLLRSTADTAESAMIDEGVAIQNCAGNICSKAIDIGDWVHVAAGSTVTKNAHRFALVLGLPAKCQDNSVIATIEWWNKVLNKPTSPVDVCQTNVDFLLSI